MKNKDIILLVDNLDIIKKAEEVGIDTFLFPLVDYSVGYEKTFMINEINTKAYLLINRNLTNDDIDKLKDLLQNLPNNIKGVVFEDFGLISILQKTNLIKVYNSKHLNCSSISVKEMLKYVDDVILSTDLMENEINSIVTTVNGHCSVYAFGLNSIFYSRRTLISNYDKEYKIKSKSDINIKEPISNKSFKVVENEFGTVFYTGKYYNALKLLNNNSIKNYYVNFAYLSYENQLKLLENFSQGIYDVANIDILTDTYNLDKATYYKLPPKEGEKNV